MQNTDNLNKKNSEYFLLIFLIFLVRAIVLESVLFRGFYLKIEEVHNFKTFHAVLDAANMF